MLLGTLHQVGNGVPQDNVKAAAWVRMAAEAGHPDAQFILGAMYREGRGVIRDRVRACMWYILAASRASGRNQQAYAIMLEQQYLELTRAEVRMAQRLARAWDEAHSQDAADGQVR